MKNLQSILAAICLALVGRSSFSVGSFGRRNPEPYTKTIGSAPSNSYDLHNFIGEDPDIIRPSLQRYFAQFHINFFKLPMEGKRHHKRELSECEIMDCYINKISEVYQLILADILKHLRKPEEREAMTLCYRALAKEQFLALRSL